MSVNKTDIIIGTSLPCARAIAGPKDSFGEDLRQARGKEVKSPSDNLLGGVTLEGNKIYRHTPYIETLAVIFL